MENFRLVLGTNDTCDVQTPYGFGDVSQ